MSNPYKNLKTNAFWKRAFGPSWNSDIFPSNFYLLRKGEKIASAGSCFAANIIPHIQKAGYYYVKKDEFPEMFRGIGSDNFNYDSFSARYGNIYTARQALQMLQRALNIFIPREGTWYDSGKFIDPFRPGLRFSASSEYEFEILTRQHLDEVIEVFKESDVFVFTYGLTESWISKIDGSVFPACPGTIAGIFDSNKYEFKNFKYNEIVDDTVEFIRLARTINSKLRFILTVSPVPLVATATGKHVLLSTVYSKSVLRAAAEEVTENSENVCYFPAYEIITGPQAPSSFFEENRRDPSVEGVNYVMNTLLSYCEIENENHITAIRSDSDQNLVNLGKAFIDAKCEEEAQGI